VYIASQYVAGSPLSGMLSRHTLQRGDRAEIARQITEAVGAAQAAGVAHLRLDASMVKVSVAGGLRASVIGFGLSAILDGRLGGPDVDASALDDLLRRLDL
jgi:tRNA A-37 threonylcarbamoyl transferase component Bud32